MFIGLLLGGLLGCGSSGVLDEQDPNGDDGDDSADAGSDGGSGGASAGNGGQAGRGGRAGASAGGAGSGLDSPVNFRRLNAYEYAYTLRDLFGTPVEVNATLPLVEGYGFDNNAEALYTSSRDFEIFFQTADELTTQVFADDALKARILTCAPGDEQSACITEIVETFGPRVWRRPLIAGEIAASIDLYQRGLALGESPEGAVRHMLRGWLSSLQFLHRMEFDYEPDQTLPQAVNAWEMASRLSYLLWSSMPDDALFARAANNELLDAEPTIAEVERLLADPKSNAFVEHFAGQWLHMDRLPTRAPDPLIFPEWTQTLREAMQTEGYLYFREFLDNELPFVQFLTHEAHFVSDELANHYGISTIPLGSTDSGVRVEAPNDLRRGFLGLGVFLASTSFPHRTSPVVRGSQILRDLLCIEIPPPPNLDIPPLDPEPDLPESATMRQRLEAHRANPACAACHALIDPLGLALENFDAIGRYRTHEPAGELIDPSGMLPDGRAFADFTQMTQLLSEDPRFLECVARKALSYALGRQLDALDDPYLQSVVAYWQASGLTLRQLVQHVVTSDLFRYRHATSIPSYL